LSLLGSYMGRCAELREAAPLFFSGQLHPIIDTTFPLREAAAAQQRLEDKEQFGKIVLTV
jgi:NADPH:quinone reductase-like Zn-dependent oxidoreductase